MCGHCRTSPGSPVAPDSTPGEATSRAPSQCLSPGVSEGLALTAACSSLPCCAHRTLLCPQGNRALLKCCPTWTAQEMDWLVLGELQMALWRGKGPGLRISGHIAARQSCDGEAGEAGHPGHTVRGTAKCQRRGQWVQEGSWGLGCEWPWASLRPPVPPCSPAKCPCGADALIPVQTGAAGPASPYTARETAP